MIVVYHQETNMPELTATEIAATLTRDQIDTLTFLHDPMNLPEGSQMRVSMGSGGSHMPFHAVIRRGLPRNMTPRQQEDHYRGLAKLGLLHDCWDISVRVPHMPGRQTTALGRQVLEVLRRI